MRSVTAAFQVELDRDHGAQPRTLLEIDVVGDTLYLSNQVVTVDTRAYTPNVLEFGRQTSQIVPGEGVVRVASRSFKLSNIDPIDDLIVAGTVVRVYDWYVGLATADKSLSFEGTIAGSPEWDDREISFTCNDIFQKFNKKFGQLLSSASWPNADPDYYGRIIPVLIGAGENLECLPIEAGAASTLRETFEVGHTSIKLASATLPLAFPPGGGTVVIGEQEYAYTGITNDDLTGVSANTTERAQYSIVIEKKAVKYLAAKSFTDTPVKALTTVRALPHSSNKLAEAILIDPSLYTIDLAETIGGEKYATILLTDDIIALRKAMQVEVTQQPDVDSTGQPSPSITPGTHKHLQANITKAYFMDTTTTNAGNYGFLTRISNGVFESGAAEPGYFSDGSYAKMQKSAIENLNGTMVSAVLKVRTWLDVGGTYSCNMQFVINGSTKKDQGITLTTGEQTFTSASFSLSGYTWSDFQNGNTYIQLVRNGGATKIYIAEAWLELTYTPPAPTKTLTPANTAVTIATEGGTKVELGGDTTSDAIIGRLICDFEGCQDKSDGHYTGSANALIEKPPDVIHFLWENFSNGATHTYLDIANTFLDARTNLPAYFKYGVAITWQVGLSTLSAQLAQMAHCRFFTSAGLAKFSRILAAGTAVKSIDTDDYSPLTTGDEKKLRVKRHGGAIEKVVNKVEVKYALNTILGGKDNPDAYAGNSESLDSAAQSSIDRWGVQRKAWLCWAIRDGDMANDLQAKLLGRNQYPRTATVFPSWAALALMEPGDLIEFTSPKLRITTRLSEILQIGNISPVPKNFQPGEVVITVRDLGVLLETLQMDMTATIGLEDLQNYKEALQMDMAATVGLDDIHPIQHEALQMDMTATIGLDDIQFFLITEDGDFLITEDGDFLVD